MSTLHIQIADLLPIMDDTDLEIRICCASGRWRLKVLHRPTAEARWERDDAELWRVLDAALSWIWREYGTPREEAK